MKTTPRKKHQVGVGGRKLGRMPSKPQDKQNSEKRRKSARSSERRPLAEDKSAQEDDVVMVRRITRPRNMQN